MDKILIDLRNLEREYPLVAKYFSDHLMRLAAAPEPELSKLRFANAITNPSSLERRLERIEVVGCTSEIVSEVGDIDNLDELNGRLIDAWAEIRVLDQLVREDFQNLSKIEITADFLASKGELSYAIQVKRIRSSFAEEVTRRNPPEKRNSSPIGSLQDIHDRLGDPLGHYFWDALEEKNQKFRNWRGQGDKRVIVIVSSDEGLSDPLVRHISCQEISKGILALVKIHFEQVWWFPDLSNGSRFYVGDDFKSICCFSDWCDDLYIPDSCDSRPVALREVDLTSPING